jgi:hypothetical protein
VFDLATRTWSRSDAALSKPRRDHAGVYDPVGRRHVIFGGERPLVIGNFFEHGPPYLDGEVVELRP